MICIQCGNTNEDFFMAEEEATICYHALRLQLTQAAEDFLASWEGFVITYQPQMNMMRDIANHYGGLTKYEDHIVLIKSRKFGRDRWQ